MAKKTTRKKVSAAPKKKTTRKKSSSAATRTSTIRTVKKKSSSRKVSKRASVKKKSSTAKKTTVRKTTSKKSTPHKKTTTKKLSTKKSPTKKKAPAKKVQTTSATASKKKTSASVSKKTTAKPKPAPRSKKRKKKRSEVALADLTPDKDGYVVYRNRRVRVISTKNFKKAEVKKTSETSVEKIVAAKPTKPVKTKLTRKELNRYRDLLRIERAERMGDLSAMEAEALRSNSGNISNMPIHMADVGSDVYEQDFMLGMAESERRLIRELDDALQRIEDGTYGVCYMTKKQIPKTRLNAKPWAKYTIEAARMIENGQVG